MVIEGIKQEISTEDLKNVFESLIKPYVSKETWKIDDVLNFQTYIKNIDHINIDELDESSKIICNDVILHYNQILNANNKHIQNIKDNEVEERTEHIQLKKLVCYLKNKRNVYICGPAGSGKTEAAVRAAEQLELNFYFTGAITNEYALKGFIDANGKYHRTPFREAFENGGLFLFDEIDASFPQALLAFNSALSNKRMDFPDGIVKMHENFRCIASANTYGLGANRMYIGRNQLDAASLDRFAYIDWIYDESLERGLAKNTKWVTYVQNIRKIVEELQIRTVVSMRASLNGAALLDDPENCFEWEELSDAFIFKGMSQTDKEKIKQKLNNRK